MRNFKCDVMRVGVKAFFICVMALGASGARGESVLPQGDEKGDDKPLFSEGVTAKEVLQKCQLMLPIKPVTLKGDIILRNRRGIPQGEYSYTLKMNRAKTPAEIMLELRERDSTNILSRTTITRPGKIPEGNVMETDVTWLDLSLDYLWWKNPQFDASKEGESVHGQKCLVILVSPPETMAGVKKVRLWADRKTGCMLQAEQLDEEGKVRRRLWGTRVKKFKERWMANVLEVETPGSGHRTKITVDELDVQ